MCKHNDKQPEGSPGAGVFKNACMLEVKLEEKEKEIENHKLTCCSSEALRFITQSQSLHVVKKNSAWEEKEKERMKEIKTKEELVQKQYEVAKEYEHMTKDCDEMVKENELLSKK